MTQRIRFCYQAELIPADLNDPQLVERIRLMDMLTTMREVLSAMLASLENDTDEGVLMTRNGVSTREAARPFPERDLWFERVWQRYRDGQV